MSTYGRILNPKKSILKLWVGGVLLIVLVPIVFVITYTFLLPVLVIDPWQKTLLERLEEKIRNWANSLE